MDETIDIILKLILSMFLIGLLLSGVAMYFETVYGIKIVL